MAKWAFLTVVLYILLVLVLFLPVLHWVVFPSGEGVPDVFEGYGGPGCVAVAIVVAAQMCLLLVPVKSADASYRPQRSIWVPVAASGLAMGVLLVGIIICVASVIWGDDIPDVIGWVSLGGLGVSWLVWSILFYRLYRFAEPRRLIDRLTAWMIRGSVLELLVAVPSHIIVRRRGDCCTPAATFLGISTGVVVMALAFGPGLFFLFRRRFEAMKPRSLRRSAVEGDG